MLDAWDFCWDDRGLDCWTAGLLVRAERARLGSKCPVHARALRGLQRGRELLPHLSVACIELQHDMCDVAMYLGSVFTALDRDACP